MTKRVIITFDDDEVEQLDMAAERLAVSRTVLIRQVCRKYIGFESLLTEDEVADLA